MKVTYVKFDPNPAPSPCSLGLVDDEGTQEMFHE